MEGTIVKSIPVKAQQNYIKPLENILEESGCILSYTGSDITVNSFNNPKHLVVYPAMWVEPHRSGTIFVSDALIKFAKPYAVQKIVAESGNALPNLFMNYNGGSVSVHSDTKDSGWQEQLMYISEEAQAVVNKLIAAHIPAPDIVGYELEDVNGASIGEAELAWLNCKVVCLLSEQSC